MLSWEEVIVTWQIYILQEKKWIFKFTLCLAIRHCIYIKIRTTTTTGKKNRQLIRLIYYVSLDRTLCCCSFFWQNFIFLTILCIVSQRRASLYRNIFFFYKNDFITNQTENRFLCVIWKIYTKIIIQIVNIKLNKCSLLNTSLRSSISIRICGIVYKYTNVRMFVFIPCKVCLSKKMSHPFYWDFLFLLYEMQLLTI